MSLIVALLSASCADPDPRDPVCTPGEVDECACAGQDAPGAQTCSTDGDGFGGPDLPPLRDQLGPEPFELGSVGVALAGRDTGLSQMFVTLRPAPHLVGEYSLVGQAEAGWERLAAGDRILKVRVREAP